MAVNKVEVNGETVLDLTNDTVSEDSLLDGTTAHNGAGNPIEGKVKLSSVSIGDNENGGIDISVDGNKKTLASQESVSQLKDGLSAAVSQHNTDTAAHNDLRLALQGLSDRINAALDSDDITLDQMSEVVAYIKSNKSLIDTITTSKVSVADIVNDLVTNVADKPLSAAQGVALKGLIDELRTLIPDEYTLPTATETTLGGVKPVTATDAMTQPVGVTADGRLVTKPGEGSSGIAVTGATVGQTVKISAVNENGVPTAWEPVDFPSGGGSDKVWELINALTVSEAVFNLVIDKDVNGENFQLKEVMLICNFEKAEQENNLNVSFGVGELFNLSIGSYPRKMFAHFEIGPNGYLLPLQLYYSSNLSYQKSLNAIGTNQVTSTVNNMPITLKHIEKIMFNCYNAASLAANSRIEVYGVRA